MRTSGRPDAAGSTGHPPDRPRVLVGFAEALAAIETAWCLEEDGFDVVAFTRRGSRPALARASSIRVVEVSAPEEDAARTVDEIRGLVERERPATLMPLDDPAVWVTDRFASGDAGATVQVAGPTGELARYTLDKRLQIAAAEAAGLAVPPTCVIGGAAVLGALPPGPWMVKPALAVVTDGGRLYRPSGHRARTPDAVRAAASRIDGPVLVQPLVTGTGEGLFGFCGESGVTAWSAHRRVRMMNPQGSGSSACRSIPVDPGLLEPATRFLEKIGWQGIFMLELLRDARGQAWFMELNGRPWGSMALARRRGFAYPAWAARAALDPAFCPQEPPAAPDATCRHLGRELVHLAAVLRGPRGDRDPAWPSRVRTLREVLTVRRGDRWYNWRPGEARVLASDTWSTLAAQLARRGRS